MAYACVLWQLSLDKELIEFGSYVVGETTSRTITLTNVGGLGTRFKFLPDSEFFEMEEPQPIMKIVSICGDHGFRSSAQSGWVGNLPVMCAQMCEPMRLSKSGGKRKMSRQPLISESKNIWLQGGHMQSGLRSSGIRMGFP